MTTLRFTKHHGLGNDFLVLLDPDDRQPLDPELVARLCDRRTGVGADGVLRASRPADAGPAVAAMELRNADGSRAEMSGNGIRCLAQALLLDGWAEPPEVPIATDAGLRVVSMRSRPEPSTHVLSVDMGRVALGEDAPEWVAGPSLRARWADVGNPHLVVEAPGAHDGDDEDVDLVALGEKVNAAVPGGANVHLVVPGHGADGRELSVRTYERGVGPTLACGTGACASAAVARGWGLVGEFVVVRMPGGTAEVELGGTARLTGPATAVAAVEYPLAAGG